METTKNPVIKKIKEKKELSKIADSVVSSTLIDYTKKYRIDLLTIKKSEKKILIKEIRSELRRLVGQYQKTPKSKALTREELLETHSSTSERMDFYLELKKIISDLKPKSILDLGCGINPLVLATKKIEYHASDINEDDLSAVRNHFKKNKIAGKVFIYDLRKIKNDLPKADLCLILKVLDIIGKNNAEKILRTIPCRKFIISFSTRKLSGKRMDHPRRIWFEKMLERLELKHKKIQSDNEIFYIILQ